MPITSPVDFISGPSAESTRASLTVEKTGALTATSGQRRAQAGLEAEVGEPLAAHHPGGQLDHRHPGDLADEGHRPRRPGVDLEDVGEAAPDDELDVAETVHRERPGDGDGVDNDPPGDLGIEPGGGVGGHRVAAVDPGPLDVLHQPGDDHGLAVRHRVDVDLGAEEVLVDQHRAARASQPVTVIGERGHRGGDEALELVAAVDHLHRPAARARRTGGPAPGSRSGRRSPPPPRGRRWPPRGVGGSRGWRISASKRRRSSARSMASTVVPRMRTPWRSSGSARLIAVWPPNWTTTPLARSASMTASTASWSSGSK